MENDQNPEKQPSQTPQDGDSISMLRKQLYQQNESQELQGRQKEMATPKTLPKAKQHEEEKAELVDVISQQREKRKRVLRMVLIVAGVVSVTAASAAGTLWYRRLHQVQPQQIGLSVNAPSDITAGSTVEIEYVYKNNSRVRWENVEIAAELPGGFIVQNADAPFAQTARQKYAANVGAVDPGSEGVLTITGRLLGEQNSAVLTRAQIMLTPENFPSGRFDASQSASITIARVPIEVSIDAAANVIEGQRIPATINIRNTGSERLEGGKLLLETVPGMQLILEDEEFSPDFSLIESSWQIPALEPLQQVTRQAVLMVEGQAGERRVLTVKAQASANNETFTLRSIDQVLTIAASEVGVSQTLNGTSEPETLAAGEKIDAQVVFKNTGTTALSNAIVSVKFESSLINPATIQTTGGAYDPANRTITWKSVSVPALALLQPQQQETLAYSFSLFKTEELPADESVKNQNLVVTATVDSPDLVERAGQNTRAVSDRVVAPVRTDVLLDVDAFYDDGRLGLPSTGPVPPEVGETTTYTTRFRLGSSLNDIGDVRLRATLPESVRYTGNTYKTEGDVTFDERTNEIFWNVPLIPGLAGRSGPGPELHVQVSITPGENVRGQTMPLLSGVAVQAMDVFADVSVGAETSKDALPDTEDASPQQGRVE